MPGDHVLHSFDLESGSEVLSWVRNSNDSRNWANLADVPGDPSIFAAWHSNPDTRPYLLFSDGTAVGYGEIWIDSAAKEVELARVLVKPACRGSGVGHRLVGLLLADAAKSGQPNAFVRVHPGNAVAIACYQHAGFRRVDAETEACWNRSQPVEYAWFHQSLSREFRI